MGNIKHPGGTEVTNRAFNICDLTKTAKILDVGCGYGDTAAYLESEYGFSVTGMDKSAECISAAREKYPGTEFISGDGQYLDFGSLSYDCVLMECSLSLIPNPAEAMHEAFCVLKKNGYLIIHDLYLPYPTVSDFEVIDDIRKSLFENREQGSCEKERKPAFTVNGALVLEALYGAIEDIGFETVLFEDRKADLDEFVASLIFSGGNLEDCIGAKQTKSQISYFLLILRKANK